MAGKLKLGLVGADAAGQGWGPVAHIPAIRGLEQFELAALCSSNPESAAAASKAYGIDRVYHNINNLVAQPDIDIISAVVRLPNHHEVVMPALHAGKHVYCEWPLGATLSQSEEMAALARVKGVVSAIGLQGRQEPALTYVKELCEEGWMGEILSVDITWYTSRSLERPSRLAWEAELKKEVTLKMVGGGHNLDYLTYCFGPLSEVSSRIETRVKQIRLADTGEMVEAPAADNILLNGMLASGALLSLRITAVPYHSGGWRMTAYGSNGVMIATTSGMPQITPIKLVGAQGNQPLTELIVPERLWVVPDTVPNGPPKNVAQNYMLMAEAIQEGKPFAPSFEDALELHQLIEAIQRSSDEGRVIKLNNV